MKHKILLSLVAVLLTALSAQAYDFQSGDLYYKITSGSTVEVTYQYSWSYSNYYGLTSAIIPSSVTDNGTTYSVTSIGNSAFTYCSGLTSITIPNSVTSIGHSAFADCSGLTSITIPNSLTSMGNHAFAFCSSLTSITIPNSVTSIGSNAFEYCSGLTSITISNSVTSIGDYAFQYCSSLTSITIPNSVTSIGNYAFLNCSGLTAITIPNSVTSIGSSAFERCSGLTSITIPNSVTSIRDGAFADCSSLTSITIPNSVTSIGVRAFYNCSGLTSITIPNSVTSIGHSAFADCSGLTAITIPNSVTSIGWSAFEYCSGLTSINLVTPSSITEIGNNAFGNTPWLTNQPDGVIYLGDVLYSYKGTMPLNTSVIVNSGTKVINRSAFTDCSGLTSITIPNSVTSMGNVAFSGCSGLTSITIPNSVTSIGNGAFSGCSGLTSIDIPNSVTSIESTTFKYCSGLTSITIPNSVTSIGSAAFSDCVQLTSITCEAKTPPSCDISSYANSFQNIPANCIIKVPCGCLEAYNTAPWNEFQLAIIPPPSLQVQPISESWGSTKIDQDVDCDSTAIVSATANYGYHFVQWTDSATSNPRTIKLTQDTLLTAEFARNSYRILTSQEGAGKVEGDSTALYKDSVTLTAVADYGWQFSCWNDNNIGRMDNPRKVEVTGDCAYRAIFVKRNFTITTAGENGTITGFGNYAYEDTCQLTAIPNTGYHFAQWSDGVTENPRSIILTKDTLFTAEFTKNSYKITLTHDGEGTIESDTTALYQDSVTLTAVADYGWQFSCWNDGIIDNPRMIIVTNNCAYRAIFVKRNFTITTSAENGTTTGSGTYAYETNCQLTATPNTGYHFAQWSDGITENPRSIVLTRDTILTAEFAKNSYRIYLTHEGEGIIEGDTIALYQDSVTLTAVADYGWEFSCWNDNNVGRMDNPRKIEVTADCAYRAIFVKRNFTITTSAENGTTTGSGTYAYETNCQLTATPNTGYHFVQWSDGVTENPRSIILTQDTNLTAEFAKNAYAINLTHEGEGSIEGDTTALYQDTITLAATADYGWQFSGWSDGVLDNPRSVVVTANCSYQAIFVRRQFSISATGENGALSGTGTFAFEDTCQVTATPNTGYHFVQWSDGITENPRSIVLTKDTNLTAEFAKNAYAINLTHEGEGSIEGDTTALYQDTIALNAIADYGWQFSGWSDGTLDNPRTIVVTADCEYHAIFVRQQFSLTAIAENGVVDGVGTFAYEDTCQLTAIPNTGYHFVQWSDGVIENPRTIVLTQDTNLSAEFAKNSYQISTSHTGNGMTMGDTTALYQDTITLSALADYGWDFSGWEDGNTENPRVVVATEDKDYKAIFVKRMFTITLTGENGTFEGAGSFAYEDTCQLTAIPNVGYHFVQWSDSITDNPRSIVLTKDTNLTAEFAQSFAGQCGDSLYWNYGDNELNITGTGAMYDYTKTTMPWMLFRDSIYLIRIGDSATYIGEYAFTGCLNLGTLFVGESVETIAENTLANCRNLHVIYCYPVNPPYAENNSFTNYNGYLYIPCDSKRDYTLDAIWGNFKYIVCLGSEDATVTDDDVTVVADSATATFTWPATDEAEAYSIVITKDGEVFCTLIFNTQGQLMTIAFAPSRDGSHRAPAAQLTANGISLP